MASMQIVSSFCGKWRSVDQNTPHWLVKIMFLGEGETALGQALNLSLVSLALSTRDAILAPVVFFLILSIYINCLTFLKKYKITWKF